MRKYCHNLPILFVLAMVLFPTIFSALASAGGSYDYSPRDLDRVCIENPHERYYNTGKYLEVFYIELKDGNNNQYSDKDFAYSIGAEVEKEYLAQQEDLPWAKAILNQYEIAQLLMDAAKNDPESNNVKINVHDYDYNAYCSQKERLWFDDISAPKAICSVGGYYYMLELNDSSAIQTEAIIKFPDVATFMAYMTSTVDKEKWDNLKENTKKFVENANNESPGKVNPDKVLVYIGDTKFSYLAISNVGFEISEGWPTVAENGYCFAMSSTAVRTYYDLDGVRNILMNSEAVASQIKSFSEANNVAMNRDIWEIKLELEVHFGGWLITDDDSSWKNRAMPADINLEASPFFIDCIIDVS